MIVLAGLFMRLTMITLFVLKTLSLKKDVHGNNYSTNNGEKLNVVCATVLFTIVISI